MVATARLPGLTILACPGYEAALANMGFESPVLDSFEAGAFPNNWTLESGVVTGKRDGVGYRRATSYHLFPTAGTATAHSLLNETDSTRFSTVFRHLRSDTPWAAMLAFRATAGTNYTLTLSADFRNGGGSLQTFSDAITSAALPADGNWRLIKSTPWLLSAATIAAVPNRVDLRAVLTPTAGNWSNPAPVVFLDWVALSVIVDGADLAGQQTEPMMEDKWAPRIEDHQEQGTFEAIRLHSGLQRGTVKLSGFAEAGAAIWRAFFRKVSGYEAFSVHDDASRFDRGFFPRCMAPPQMDGLRPTPGTRNFKLSFNWEESA